MYPNLLMQYEKTLINIDGTECKISQYADNNNKKQQQQNKLIFRISFYSI